ncbi:MAG: hypothetical protein PVS3B1_07570 [Ktedonobacteraceae bacterium]
MTQQDNLDQLEKKVQGMQWETVSLEPLQEDVQALDQQLPTTWTELLDQHEFGQEEIQALMNAALDIPEGDITENARRAIEEFNVDVNGIMQQLDEPDYEMLEREIENNRQDDFGR